MEDYYKKRYEEISIEKEKQCKELSFYRNTVFAISGVTTGILITLLFIFLPTLVLEVKKNWINYSIADKIAIFGLVITVVGAFVRYGRKIFNWPEELYLYKLKREKEVEKIKE